jgi:hypothetical protein
MAIDEARLMEFLDRFVGDLGATMAAGNIVVGDRLGLYRALAGGPLQPQELAARTGTAPRYVDEWLRGQAASGYVEYDPETGTYWLTEEQSFALTNPDGPVFAPGAFQLAVAALRAEPEIAEAFRSGAGVGWHAHDADVFAGCERFFRPGYSPVGRVYYSFSTFLCVPNALSQEGGYSLGAQAGEDLIRRIATDAGFGRFRRVAETPFNLVYEARR